MNTNLIALGALAVLCGASSGCTAAVYPTGTVVTSYSAPVVVEEPVVMVEPAPMVVVRQSYPVRPFPMLISRYPAPPSVVHHSKPGPHAVPARQAIKPHQPSHSSGHGGGHGANAGKPGPGGKSHSSGGGRK